MTDSIFKNTGTALRDVFASCEPGEVLLIRLTIVYSPEKERLQNYANFIFHPLSYLFRASLTSLFVIQAGLSNFPEERRSLYP